MTLLHLHHHHMFNQPHELEPLYQTETTPHSLMAPAPIIDDTQARINRIEQRIRSLHVSDGVIGWDGYDDLPVAALPVEFSMPDIERYTGIGCVTPRPRESTVHDTVWVYKSTKCHIEIILETKVGNERLWNPEFVIFKPRVQLSFRKKI